MGKNILIFSDGTGQAGGIRFDEARTNIYKLYRATRCGPDSSIDPNEQVAFYDPGLGSPADGGFMFGKTGRWAYNIASQATGLGLTANIVDCYAAIIRLYRDGDRIFLFGFSRGAYTVRCLAAVIAKCGIPRHLPGNEPLPLDIKGSRTVAEHAVKRVYQFCTTRSRTKKEGTHWNFLLDTREEIARRFREDHGSFNPEQPGNTNCYPYFIGVFDTVAALARPAAVFGLLVALAGTIALLSLGISLSSAFSQVPYVGWFFAQASFEHVLVVLSAVTSVIGLIAVLRTYIKYDFGVPGYGWLQSLRTIHIAPPKQKFTEYTLNGNVEYAKHAISIDENRRDFARVRWYPTETRDSKRDAFGNLHFEQVWFPGVHADIGGGYSENESRLSDVTLKWMLAAASIVPSGVRYDERVLSLFSDPAGPQHDECKAGHWQRGVRIIPADEKTGISVATMHASVFERFEALDVVTYDRLDHYRPENLRKHADFMHYYDEHVPTPTGHRKSISDDIEMKWERQKAEKRSRVLGLDSDDR